MLNGREFSILECSIGRNPKEHRNAHGRLFDVSKRRNYPAFQKVETDQHQQAELH
jgi:hypothetical protein